MPRTRIRSAVPVVSCAFLTLTARPAIAIDIEAANEATYDVVTTVIMIAVLVSILVVGALVMLVGRGQHSSRGLDLHATSSRAERRDIERRHVPYRDRYLDSAVDSSAAQGLLAAAHDHHFSKRFGDARVVYQQLVDQHGDTKQAAVARQQLENLRHT